MPRPGDGNLRYVGGETRVVAVSKNTTFQDIMNKLENMCVQNIQTDTARYFPGKMRAKCVQSAK